MKGQKIKEILRAEGITLSEVATLLGFDNDQRLHSALRSDDVKSGLIEDIARVTNKVLASFTACPCASMITVLLTATTRHTTKQKFQCASSVCSKKKTNRLIDC